MADSVYTGKITPKKPINKKRFILIICLIFAFMGCLFIWYRYELVDNRTLEYFIHVFEANAMEERGLPYDKREIEEKYQEIQTVYIPEGKIRIYYYGKDSSFYQAILYEYPNASALSRAMRKNKLRDFWGFIESGYEENGKFLMHYNSNIDYYYLFRSVEW